MHRNGVIRSVGHAVRLVVADHAPLFMFQQPGAVVMPPSSERVVYFRGLNLHTSRNYHSLLPENKSSVKLRTGPRKSSRQSSEIAVQIQTDWNVK